MNFKSTKSQLVIGFFGLMLAGSLTAQEDVQTAASTAELIELVRQANIKTTRKKRPKKKKYDRKTQRREEQSTSKEIDEKKEREKRVKLKTKKRTSVTKSLSKQSQIDKRSRD